MSSDDVLLLSIPAQQLPDDRGWVSEHRVQGRLRSPSLELELYGYRLPRRSLSLVSVGVWACGDYVHWRDERDLDFNLLDVIDSALRLLLPPGGGVCTMKDDNPLTSGSGVNWSWQC